MNENDVVTAQGPQGPVGAPHAAQFDQRLKAIEGRIEFFNRVFWVAVAVATALGVHGAWARVQIAELNADIAKTKSAADETKAEIDKHSDRAIATFREALQTQSDAQLASLSEDVPKLKSLQIIDSAGEPIITLGVEDGIPLIRISNPVSGQWSELAPANLAAGHDATFVQMGTYSDDRRQPYVRLKVDGSEVVTIGQNWHGGFVATNDERGVLATYTAALEDGRGYVSARHPRKESGAETLLPAE